MEQEELLKKWLNDELSTSEKEAFEMQDDAILNTKIVNQAKYFKASESFKVNDYSVFSEKLKRSKKTPKAIKISRFAPQLAAALIIGLAIFFFLNRTTETSISTKIAEKEQLGLPDKSNITLNAKSTITYNKNNWKNNRVIHLNGEAFFDVEKGKTFDVITPLGNVTVLGTEFNVKQRGDFFEVKCYEGLVKVTHNNTSYKLPVGKAIRFANGALTKFAIDDATPQWTKNISKFSNVPVNAVFEELQRQYNITLDYSQINTSRLFTGAFEHNNIDNALMAITRPLQFTYEKKSSNHIIILNATRE